MENKGLQKQLNESRKRNHAVQGDLNYLLEVFGDGLAEQHGYHDLDGLDAVRYYLMQKHHWLPAQVRAMSMDDLHFAISQEIAGWTLPPEA